MTDPDPPPTPEEARFDELYADFLETEPVEQAKLIADTED